MQTATYRTRIRSAFTPSAFLDAFISSSLSDALTAHAGRIRAVDVRLADVNGPRHGAPDKRTTIAVTLRPFGEVIVRSTAPDVYRSVQLASARARRALTRYT